MCMLFTSIKVAASEQINRATDYSEIYGKMCNILVSAEDEKEEYGLKGMDYFNVEIGKEIPVYEVKDSALYSMNLYVFPILKSGEIISFFYAAKDINGEWYVQLGNEFTELLKEVAMDSEIAFVYDRDGVYLYTEEKLQLLAYAENQQIAPDIENKEYFLKDKEEKRYNKYFARRHID